MELNDKEIDKLFIELVRYSLTRHSYAPSECADLIRAKWGEIPENTKVIIIRDVHEAIEDNDRIDRQYKWPNDIRRTWTDLRYFMGYPMKYLRPLADVSQDTGSGVYFE